MKPLLCKMAAWSSVLRFTGQKILGNAPILQKQLIQAAQQRCMSGHNRAFEITASRWQWHKTKDFFHFYTMLGVIPLGIGIFYAYVFVGPATLEPIPEGYTPKQWEYFRNPIHRFMARYFRVTPQQEYEKYLHMLYEEDEKARIRLLQTKIEKLMRDKHDYEAWYYKPYDDLKYLYRKKELIDKFNELKGYGS